MPQLVTRPTVVVIGAGAAGTLTAIQLLRAASRRATALDLVLLDPADRWGRGVAYGTTDDRHLLNVPASGMSALPENPGHFVDWLAAEPGGVAAEPGRFATRRQFGRYLDETLTDAVASTYGLATLRHAREEATGIRRTPTGVTVSTETAQWPADAVVVATGNPPIGVDWAPAALRESPFFVADPWRPGAVDVVRRDRSGPSDVLLVGTGLTAVDLVLSLSSAADARPDRRLYAISRHGRLPRAHAAEQALAVIPDVSDWGDSLAEIRAAAERYVRGVEATTGDWRPGVDGLRFQVATLWSRLSADDRHEFLARDARRWNELRHRMAPDVAADLERVRREGRLDVAAAEVEAAAPLTGGGLTVTLTDGRRLDVGWVVNCTGPRLDVVGQAGPLLADLVGVQGGTSLGAAGFAGLGLDADDTGRLLNGAGDTDAPIWTLGALRRSELWESTAVPEIRTQAVTVAGALLDAVAPLPRRLADGRLVSGHHPVARPRDPLGLPISTTADAAAAFNAGLERLMSLQGGADTLIREATELDPGFALAHAALALLGHEAGADADVAGSLAAAQDSARDRADAREASLVDVVTQRVRDVQGAGAQALLAHVARHPRDVLAVSAAVPTIAFSGVTDVQQETWDLVEGLGSAYGDHWWYISLLAFARQDQGRFEDAGLLAESALSCEPSSGHAAHALAHVLYETGQHGTGRVWLDHWVAESGRTASHRAHFSWHAALHELHLGDTEAVRARYYSQLAPPLVTGVRSLVDSASLLWRWRVTTADWDRAAHAALHAPPAFDDDGGVPPVRAVLDTVDETLLTSPLTPFVAFHSAFGLAGAAESGRLRLLRDHCASSSDAVLRGVVATVCDALGAFLENRWAAASELLTQALPGLVRVGGSAAQREIVEETLLFCYLNEGRLADAVALIDARLDRRPSPLDRRRLAAATRGDRSEITY